MLFVGILMRLVEELADLDVVFFLDDRDYLLQGGGVTRVFVINMPRQVFAHGTLYVNVLEVLDIWDSLTQFLSIISKLCALDFAWLINALILTNIF